MLSPVFVFSHVNISLEGLILAQNLVLSFSSCLVLSPFFYFSRGAFSLSLSLSLLFCVCRLHRVFIWAVFFF